MHVAPAIIVLAVAVQQLVDGHLDGDERRGARGVDDAVHAVQVEDVGAAAGDHVAEEAGEGVEPPLGEVRLVLGRPQPRTSSSARPCLRSTFSTTT